MDSILSILILFPTLVIDTPIASLKGDPLKSHLIYRGISPSDTLHCIVVYCPGKKAPSSNENGIILGGT